MVVGAAAVKADITPVPEVETEVAAVIITAVATAEWAAAEWAAAPIAIVRTTA